MKQCRKCKEIKSEDCFRFNPSRINPKRLRSQCIECDRAVHRSYYKANKEKIAKDTLEYQRKNPLKRKGYKLKLQYGSTLQEYQSLLLKQNGRCAICKTSDPSTKTKRTFCLDHDHKTGKIRGLLCDNCNKALGCLKDNTENLTSAIEYLNAAK